ncbi:Titin [Fasciola hepatica]|uniref:Titin n=1 Tax=Fasciola hepatica TaxID=6192 RepID=A0A4E0R6L8_FASHE|nr:Titin [Fasciola hepatica]
MALVRVCARVFGALLLVGMKLFTISDMFVVGIDYTRESTVMLSRLCIPLEFVRPLEDVALTEAPTEPVVLECELSRKPREKVQWLKDGKPLSSRLPDHMRVEEDANGTVHRVIFTSLQDEDLGQYTIRVEKLSGDARVDLRVPPTLRLTDKFKDKLILKAGESSVVEVPFVANPKPTVRWSWKPRVTPTSEPGLPQQPRFKPDVVSGLTSLPFGKVKREDAGDYEVVISNELGEVTVTVQLIVLDKPSVPRQLEVSENTGESVLFSWCEPEFTGLSADIEPGTGLAYVIEMREATQRVGKPVTTTSDLKTSIEGLQTNKSYIFSVAAKNDVGQSDFVDTKPVSTKLEYGPPQSPMNVKAVVNPQKASIEQQTIDLTWEQPSDTVSGAGPVVSFYIEMKPKDSTRWQDVSAGMTITEPHFTLPSDGMNEFTSYEFRVVSENKAGKSKPSGPSNLVEFGE